MQSWQPTTTLDILQRRAHVLSTIRDFFQKRGVLEVDTPLLSASTVTDPHLHSFSTAYQLANGEYDKTLYLQTSPEFSMKRLVASGSGPIYQLAHAFRNRGEKGRWHNPEFMLLEWYRPGFTLTQLMDETDTLLQTILRCRKANRLTYAELFEQFAALNPHEVTLQQLRDKLMEHRVLFQSNETLINLNDGLQLLLDDIIRKHMNTNQPLFIYDFPVSQAALARIRSDSPPVAERVEVYVEGIELANGFHELSDAAEQKQRFLNDLHLRQSQNLPQVPLDKNLLSALTHGLPDCSGIALGIDRLVALASRSKTLTEVITFPIDRA